MFWRVRRKWAWGRGFVRARGKVIETEKGGKITQNLENGTTTLARRSLPGGKESTREEGKKRMRGFFRKGKKKKSFIFSAGGSPGGKGRAFTCGSNPLVVGLNRDQFCNGAERGRCPKGNGPAQDAKGGAQLRILSERGKEEMIEKEKKSREEKGNSFSGTDYRPSSSGKKGGTWQ